MAPAMIDFASVRRQAGDLRALVARDLGPAGTDGKHTCPFHGLGGERTPSLAVYDDHFFCYACGEHGDAISWVARRDSLSIGEAARRIDPTLANAMDRPGRVAGLHPQGLRDGLQSPRQWDARGLPGDPGPTGSGESWRNPDWQVKIDRLVRRAEGLLWSDVGRPALDWLRRRGLEDHTICRYRLGFIDAPFGIADPVKGMPDRPGRPLKLRADRGITIPWLAPGAWYSPLEPTEGGERVLPRWVGMNVRRLARDVDAPLPPAEPKCKAVAGSRRGYLYPWPDLLPPQGIVSMLLVEGEFDALIGDQQVGHLVHVGTTGSASGSARNLPAATKVAIARCPWLLLAHDMDRAGISAARDWRETYPHKSRRVQIPQGKDLNEFASAGGDLVGWIEHIQGKLKNKLST